jgi:small conductance mechanosensitive channel
VKDIINKAITGTNYLLTNPAARVGIVSMEVDSVRITINVWVDPANFLTAKIELQEKIFKGFSANGVNFPKAG